jgi:hypothetical protein
MTGLPDFPEPVSITLTVAPVPYPGGSTQAEFYRTAAERWRDARLMGSNCTSSVGATLDAIADALEAAGAPKWRVVNNVSGLGASQSFDTEEKANFLCRSMNLHAGPGGLYGVQVSTDGHTWKRVLP